MEMNKTRNYIFLITLGGVSLLFFYVINPFFYPIFWAAVIASLFYPLFKRFTKLLNPSISAALTLVIVTVMVLLPLSLIVTLLIKEIVNIFNSYGQTDQLGGVIQDVNNFLHNNELIQKMGLNDTSVSGRLDEIGRSVVTFVYVSVKSLTQNSLEFIALFVLMLYSLFFFLRDGDKILKKLMYIFPLGNRYEQLLYDKFTAAASSAIKGTVIVGLIQGVLGGLLFWVTGVPGPLIWGLIMAALGAIPVTGTFLVWFPAGLIKIATGHMAQGVIILTVGILLVSTIDNILRPFIVGKELEMHPVIVLFSTLGGVVVFGLSGFVLGPIIAALCQSFWDL
ncbi:MAG: AI-2E family transporter [Patescibacteria group bacterium]|jgi:predicted PurR-regulated permease PerM